jgi:GT2 family glycosyltransferase
MSFSYRKTRGVEFVRRDRPLLSTGADGFVALDETLLSLWHAADGKSPAGVLSSFRAGDVPGDHVRAGLACLAEAGFLEREGAASGRAEQDVRIGRGGRVSAIVPITSLKERDWLGDCLASLSAQTYEDIEVLVVDNATAFGLAEWLQAEHPRAGILRLERMSPFATALNAGAARSRGDYLFFLNPDLKLRPRAVAEMVAAAEGDPRCGAVAAKLKFWWAPNFLNGIGNRVRDFGWGTDNAIGHLDLGQFDGWEDVPSACFAAALIPRRAWDAVGPVDERFQLYYEDTEWCYRARLLGFTVRAAPRAEILHIFGGWVREPGQSGGLSPWKIRNAVYGRLRFAAKLLGPELRRRFRRNYLREDFRNFAGAIRCRTAAETAAYARAWSKFVRDLPGIRRQRRNLRKRAVCSDDGLFVAETGMPQLRMWRDIPELTWEMTASDYLPHILAGRTRPMPEFK